MEILEKINKRIVVNKKSITWKKNVDAYEWELTLSMPHEWELALSMPHEWELTLSMADVCF